MCGWAQAFWIGICLSMRSTGKALLAIVSLSLLLGLGWWALESVPTGEQKSHADDIDPYWLAEMQASARLLSDSLLTTGNVKGALAMLDVLDVRIARQPAQEKLAPVRLALAADRQRLLAAGALDLNQAAMQIEAIILDIDSLPLISSPMPLKSAPSDAERVAVDLGFPSLKDIIAGLQSRLAELVRIRRVENPEAVFLTPEQGALVTERLRLRLLSARLALVSRQDKVFALDIAQAKKILGDVFDPQNSKVIGHKKTLEAIGALAQKMPLPPKLALSDALEALKPPEASAAQ